jgi:hypothetical protein|tara:strand:- start:43 stop:435 length:393 start_codon:yes stop_codon:yes gene_type:complete
MEKETKQDILNRLFKENNLTSDDIFVHKHFKIITRSGIDKIMSKNEITITYNLIYNSPDLKYVIIKAIGKMGDKVIETFGECSPQNNANSYGVSMAEKRAKSRICLMLCGLYEQSVYSEDEAPAFNRNNN